MGASSRSRQPHPHRALTPGLDETGRRLTENCDVRREPLRDLAFDPSQAVVRCGDLFAVVEDEGQIVGQVLDGGRKV